MFAAGVDGPYVVAVAAADVVAVALDVADVAFVAFVAVDIGGGADVVVPLDFQDALVSEARRKNEGGGTARTRHQGAPRSPDVHRPVERRVVGENGDVTNSEGVRMILTTFSSRLCVVQKNAFLSVKITHNPARKGFGPVHQLPN